ncbi:hypothetical protein DY000_02020764 [Brassica cretica]|uniref:Uncharacterized protein n=1 Tax=Brassica cretica TaxID=69181 RepID=A0ABQ7EFV7_BRACR|nr:hypothetical protein DY000_02020764 [Brassica cretica]
MKTLRWREFETKPKTEAKEERQIQRTGLWYGLDRWEETRLRWGMTSSVFGKRRSRRILGIWTSSYHGESECYGRATVRDDPAIIQQKTIVEALKRTLKEPRTFLEARRFRSSTFWKNDVSSARSFRKTSYQRNIVSKTLEAGHELITTGSKHDRIEARQENPKLDENPNFGIMEVFDEAEGSENIYRQGQSSDWSLLKIFSSSEREQKNIRD